MNVRKLRILLLAVAVTAWTGAEALAQQPLRVRQRLERAESLYRMEKYGAAYQELRRVQRDWIDADAAERELLERQLALCAAQAERRDAQALLEHYVATYPKAAGINAVRFELGNLYFGQENYPAAIAQYEAVRPGRLTTAEQDEYRFKYGYACFCEQKPEQAQLELEQVAFTSPYYPHAQYLIGYMAYRRGDYAEAKQAFTVIADDPTYRNVLPFYLLQIEFNEGNYHYVRENGAAVLRMAAGDRQRELTRIVGESWFQTGGWRETIQYLRRYAELGGHQGREELYMLGFSSYMIGEYDDAERYLSQVAGPDDKLSQNASYHLADCYLRKGEKQLAMQSFAMAATEGEGYDESIAEDALFNYGKLQYELGGGYFNEAINVLNRYLERYPQSSHVPQVKEYLAAAYYNSHNYDAAYRAIMQVPDPDNNLKAALQKITYFRGLEYFNEGDYTMARRLLDQSLANRFNAKYTALAGYWLGEIGYREGNWEEAADRYAAYVRLSPRNEPENRMARYNLGYVYFNRKDWENARKWFDDFLVDNRLQDSYVADAYNRLGDIAYSGRSFWRAIEFYDKAAAVGTDERYYSAYQRARMLGMVQRPERKIESLQEIVRKGEGPYVAEATFELGRTYMGGQQYDKAAKVLEQFVAAYPSSPRYAAALNELGLAYQNLGNDAKALDYYKQVMGREKNSDAARNAMNGIRTIYVERNDVDTYFAYAESVGVETDLGEVQRDSLAFVAAQRVYLSGDRERASYALDNYMTGYPKGAHFCDALYFAGENALAAGNPERALKYYRRLAEMRDNDFTERGLERLASLGMEQGAYDDAAEAYKRLAGLSTAPAKRDAALGGYLKAVRAAKRDDATVLAVAEEVLAQVADERVKRQAIYAKADVLRRSGQAEEALPLFAQISDDVSTPEGAESAYRVIEAARRRGDNGRVETLVYAFADKNTPYMYWLGRSFLILGDIYAEKGDTFQARATYQSIVDGYPSQTDGVVKEARERIAALK